MSSFSHWVWCVCLLLICLKEGLGLIESNQNRRYVISIKESFLKSKDIVDVCNFLFDISEWLIQCNTNSCYEHISGAVIIYLYIYVSVYWSLCVMCLCLFVCARYQIKVLGKVIYVKPTTNLTTCCIKHIARCFWYLGSSCAGLSYH